MAPNFELTGKVIALTGGASGIGLATAKFLLSQGAVVSAADNNEKNLQDAEAEFSKIEGNAKFMTQVVDVRQREQVDDWVSKTVQKFGKLDGAVNLAGVIPKNFLVDRVEEMDEDDWVFTIDVNLTGVMHSMRAEIPNMNTKGSIINASSIAGLQGFPRHSAYTAAKHAVIGLSRSAAKEVGDREIRVNCISPGIIDTPMHQAANKSRGGDGKYAWQINRKGQPEEVAALIAWLLCDQSTYITGTVQVIDGGWTC